MLEEIVIKKWSLENKIVLHDQYVFYQTFGLPLGTAPVVLVNHALTGNSNVTGQHGWWNDLIGQNKAINTNQYTVIAINIPGNGYVDNQDNLIDNYKDYTIRDIAKLFWQVLQELHINDLYAVIGGSLGGAISWEMAIMQPNSIQNIIPIAADWKATDWMIANVLLQDNILNNSNNPIVDARIHAMLLYRTPESLTQRFQREVHPEKQIYQIESWLIHHGNKLQNRFKLSAYKLMNYLLKTNDITRNRNGFLAEASAIKGNIHIIAVNTDLFFVAQENINSYTQLKDIKQNTYYHEIQSIHGHDAFLIEYNQLSQFLNPIFNTIKQHDYVKN